MRGMGTTHVGCRTNDAIFLCCCTLRQHEVRIWSRGNSWYYTERACSLPLKKDIADLREPTVVEVDHEVDHHKDESTSIIKTDADDRNAIRDKLETCVDPH